jgi:hypothetical protein
VGEGANTDEQTGRLGDVEAARFLFTTFGD